MKAETTTLREVKEGDRLTVERWNALVHAVNRGRIIPSLGGGLDIQTTPAGTIVRVRSQYAGFVGYSVTAITARSGTTAGSGSVSPVTLNASTSQLSTGSANILVWNAASQSIASGKYCWAEPDNAGNLFVGPLDC